MSKSRWRSACASSVLVVLLAGGCAREPEPPAPGATPPSSALDTLAATPVPEAPVNPFAEPARRALRIELALDDYRTVEGTWTAGDASSSYTAYLDGDSLRFIEERLNMGEYGDETNVYYFADGALFYAVQDGVRVRLDAAAAVRRDTVQLRIALAPDGTVLATEGTVNGESEVVDRVLIEGVRRHAEALRDRLRATTGPSV